MYKRGCLLIVTNWALSEREELLIDAMVFAAGPLLASGAPLAGQMCKRLPSQPVTANTTIRGDSNDASYLTVTNKNFLNT